MTLAGTRQVARVIAHPATEGRLEVNMAGVIARICATTVAALTTVNEGVDHLFVNRCIGASISHFGMNMLFMVTGIGSTMLELISNRAVVGRSIIVAIVTLGRLSTIIPDRGLHAVVAGDIHTAAVLVRRRQVRAVRVAVPGRGRR